MAEFRLYRWEGILRNPSFGKGWMPAPPMSVRDFLWCTTQGDFLTNAYKGYYLRIDQRFSPAFLGNDYAFSSTELTTSYYRRVWKGGILAGQFHTLLTYGNPPWGLMATLGSSLLHAWLL